MILSLCIFRVHMENDVQFEKNLEEDCVGIHGCIHYHVGPEQNFEMKERI